MSRPSLLAATVLAAALAAATSTLAADQDDARAAAESIMKQLDAFRRDDFDAAYGFASAEIRNLFDRGAFERMVKGGYPEIARSTLALIAGSDEDADGHVRIRVKIRGANGNGVEALYDMVREPGGWRVNGVVTRPDPGWV